MALPFLPAGHITETFHQLQARANSVQLTQLVDYVNRQWINNAIFRVEDWSVFRRSIRTNNDVEGWHHRLNSQAHHGAVPFYVLVPALRKEAEMVDISVQSSDLEREQRSSTVNARLEEYWTKYSNGEVSTSTFLKAVSHLYGPSE
ncbi:uncharacterized protein LOC127861593 [Dreissena polymorpha]|uniref:uncharacterized protein LOC127848242 n=1 Tax=Dreissena polymorpha TaxID=45954 RepID=UPI0022645AE9|nr:uncharacterized protein LOC127848242 [Dreissena polymorpha]XP_052256169.1 uncharacterized protein LOC127861593 [Dreissena polymorpha]